MLRAALAIVVSLSAAAAPAQPKDPDRLDLARLYVASAKGAWVVAPEVEALDGQRVRVTGYMADMEEYAPRGALFLTRLPVETDEGGGGTADLPPGALRVEVPRLRGEELAWVRGEIEVIGILRVGRTEDEYGRVSWLRLISDDPPTPAAPRP